MCISYITTSIDAIALNFEEISAVQTLETNGYIIVAVVPYSVETKSARTKIANDIKSRICNELSVDNDKVIVTYDLEVFRRISNGDTDDEKILSLALKRNYPL